jgi:hypothetical protein
MSFAITACVKCAPGAGWLGMIGAIRIAESVVMSVITGRSMMRLRVGATILVGEWFMLSDTLSQELKKAIGYTEGTPKVCENCKYFEIPIDWSSLGYATSKDKDAVCHVAGDVGTFYVRKTAVCNKFKAKA